MNLPTPCRSTVAAFVVMALAVLACTTVTPFPTQAPSITPVVASPTALPLPTPLPTITRLPPTPTASPSPTRPPRLPTVTRAPSTSSVKLPAPLYLIDSNTKQIVRLETDGKTITPITSEAKPVTDFDVSPQDGALAYVSDNDLILTDAMGRNRKVLVNGDPLTPMELENSRERRTRVIESPRWSPDGSRIAYGKGGVNVVTLGGGEPQLIQSNDLVDYSNTSANPAGRRFAPLSWSSDGTRLLLEFHWLVEAGGHAVKNLGDGRLVELESSTGAYYRPSWNANGTEVYRCDIATMMGSGCGPDVGLHVLDASTGKLRLLISGTGDECPIVKSPYQVKDGELYMLMAFASTEELFFQVDTPPISFGMYRAAPDGSKRVLLRDDTYNVWDALWASDVSGAVVISGKTSWWEKDESEVLWVPADNSKPLVLLPVNGGTLRWGK